MATAAGLQQSAVSHFEAGLRPPDLDRLARAAAIPGWALDGVLLPAVRLARRLAANRPPAAASRDRLLPALDAEWVEDPESSIRASFVELIMALQCQPDWEQRLAGVLRSTDAAAADRTTIGPREEPDGPSKASDLQVLIGLLRLLRNGTYADWAKAAGLHKATVSRYRTGVTRPDGRELRKLAEAASVSPWVAFDVLLPAIETVREISGLPQFLVGGSGFMAKALLAEDLSEAVKVDIDRYRALLAGQTSPTPAQATRPTRNRPVVSSALSLHDFERTLEQACAESSKAAADDAPQALATATAALDLARSATGDRAWRSGLEGYCWAFIANAQRVGGDLRAAAKSLAFSWRLWRSAGSAASLGEWRLLDLEASLRRDQRRFEEALGLLDRALAIAPAEQRCRLLLNKQSTLDQAGELSPALSVLQEAESLLDAAAEPRLHWVAAMNRLVLLWRLGRHVEATTGLDGLRRLTVALGNRLDLTRVLWLSGRLAAAAGRRSEAYATLEATAREFTVAGIGYDAALVFIELTILDLQDGRAKEAARRATEMVQIFRSQQVGPETLAAVRLFCDAAQRGTATVNAARRLLAELERRPPYRGSS